MYDDLFQRHVDGCGEEDGRKKQEEILNGVEPYCVWVSCGEDSGEVSKTFEVAANHEGYEEPRASREHLKGMEYACEPKEDEGGDGQWLRW